ncbi:hypothetical protein BX600DRAFT_440977 [Xylariales sp. PMI_506]|nr:hypothetical protein BX600DRAFT_440977 [Xylariales sp. PMI_506]
MALPRVRTSAKWTHPVFSACRHFGRELLKGTQGALSTIPPAFEQNPSKRRRRKPSTPKRKNVSEATLTSQCLYVIPAGVLGTFTRETGAGRPLSNEQQGVRYGQMDWTVSALGDHKAASWLQDVGIAPGGTGQGAFPGSNTFQELEIEECLRYEQGHMN